MSGTMLRKTAARAAALLVLALTAGCGGPGPSRSGGVPVARTPSAPVSSPYYAAPAVVAAQPVVIAPQPAHIPSVPAPVSANLAGKTVILDAGHGGHDEGTSHFGLREKDISLDLATRAAALLRASGCAVVMTRTGDRFVPLPERSAVANRSPNAVLVSIHVNAAPDNPSASGVETFVLSSEFSDQERGRLAASRYRVHGGDPARGRQALANLAVRSRSRGPALASSLQRSLCSGLGGPDRGVKTKNLAVLRETYFGPAALVEVGFLTNPQSARQMSTAAWRARAAESIAAGIRDFLAAY